MKTLLSPEEEAKQKAEREEAKWDVIYMAIAVFCTLTLVTVMMVGFKNFQPSLNHDTT